MTTTEFQEMAGWLVAALMGTGMGIRTFMTMWSKERATASKADVANERAQAEIDVIALLRGQLDELRASDANRTLQIDQMRNLIDRQANDIHTLHSLVQKLSTHINKMERLLAQHNIEVPRPPDFSQMGNDRNGK